LRFLFSGGRVFDGTGTALREADVVGENGRFVSIESHGDGDVATDVS
jgi:hypothetical protein